MKAISAESCGRWFLFALAGALLSGGVVPALLGAEEPDTILKSGAAVSEAEALNAFGTQHANGEGVPRDDAKALSYYQQAADRGFAAAFFNLGMFHELGRGVPADLANAFKLYLKAAERGFAPAQFNVGNMYANGAGVKQDFFEAIVWFRQAAEQGVPEAQFNLGLAYEQGRGVRKDDGLAVRWYRRAAARNNPRAQFNLAVMYDEGRGLPGGIDDPAAATTLYRAAATQNFPPAQNNLGLLLAAGRGGPVDSTEAYVWLTLAAENGVTSEVRAITGQKLSPAELNQANAYLVQLRAQLGMKEPADARAKNVAAVTPGRAGQASGDERGREFEALKKSLTAVEAELDGTRLENIRLASLARAAEQSRVEADRRLAAVLPSTSSAELTAFSETQTLERLAALDPRVAKLVADNERLSEQMKQSQLEIAQLNAQLRIVREPRGASVATVSDESAASNSDAAKVVELTRRLEVLRNTVDRLAQESRWSTRVIADLRQASAESEKIKAGRPGSR